VDWSKEDYPEDLEFEALVDVLRGRVKVNIHCYEAGTSFCLPEAPNTHLFRQLTWMASFE
jgi:hypothetical protein